jgi:hypothetical protein
MFSSVEKLQAVLIQEIGSLSHANEAYKNKLYELNIQMYHLTKPQVGRSIIVNASMEGNYQDNGLSEEMLCSDQEEKLSLLKEEKAKLIKEQDLCYYIYKKLIEQLNTEARCTGNTVQLQLLIRITVKTRKFLSHAIPATELQTLAESISLKSFNENMSSYRTGFWISIAFCASLLFTALIFGLMAGSIIAAPLTVSLSMGLCVGAALAAIIAGSISALNLTGIYLEQQKNPDYVIKSCLNSLASNTQPEFIDLSNEESCQSHCSYTGLAH